MTTFSVRPHGLLLVMMSCNLLVTVYGMREANTAIKSPNDQLFRFESSFNRGLDELRDAMRTKTRVNDYGLYGCEILVSTVMDLPAVYNYISIPGLELSSKSAILVYAKSTNDVHVSLNQILDNYTANTMYEIVIGGWSNTQSVIRKAKQGTNLATVSTPGILDGNSYRSFWITWTNGVQVGLGTVIGRDPFMVYHDATPSGVNFTAISSWPDAGGSAYFKVLP